MKGRLVRLSLLPALAGAAAGSPLPVQPLPRRLPSLRCQTPASRLRVAMLRRRLQQAAVQRGAVPAAAVCQQPGHRLQASPSLLQQLLQLQQQQQQQRKLQQQQMGTLKQQQMRTLKQMMLTGPGTTPQRGHWTGRLGSQPSSDSPPQLQPRQLLVGV